MPKVDSRRFCVGAAPPVSVVNTGVFFGVAFGRGIAAGVTSPPDRSSTMLPEPCSTAMTIESSVQTKLRCCCVPVPTSDSVRLRG